MFGTLEFILQGISSVVVPGVNMKARWCRENQGLGARPCEKTGKYAPGIWVTCHSLSVSVCLRSSNMASKQQKEYTLEEVARVRITGSHRITVLGDLMLWLAQQGGRCGMLLSWPSQLND